MQNLAIQLQQQSHLSLMYYLTLANDKLQVNYPEPLLTYRNKGTVAGSAYISRWEIQLNKVLLLEHQQTFIDEVIPHELAHLIAFRHFGRVKPHGQEWRSIMLNIFAKQPKTTHQFVVTMARPHRYNCLCQEHQLSTIRHLRSQKNKIHYICKKCNSVLKQNVIYTIEDK